MVMLMLVIIKKQNISQHEAVYWPHRLNLNKGRTLSRIFGKTWANDSKRGFIGCVNRNISIVISLRSLSNILFFLFLWQKTSKHWCEQANKIICKKLCLHFCVCSFCSKRKHAFQLLLLNSPPIMGAPYSKWSRNYTGRICAATLSYRKSPTLKCT